MVTKKTSSDEKPKLSIVSTPEDPTSSSTKPSTDEKLSMDNAEGAEDISTSGKKKKPRRKVHKDLEPDPLAVAIAQIDPETKGLLERIYLRGMSMRNACIDYGCNYYPSKSEIKHTKLVQPYIQWLLDRQMVMNQFGVDDVQLIDLIKIRDAANKVGNSAAAVRAHELCMRAVGRLKADEKKPTGERDVEDMSREEILDEMKKLKIKADGPSSLKQKSKENDDVEELKRGMLPTHTPDSPPNEVGRMVNES